MVMKQVQLRSFSEGEILLDDRETRDALGFFFTTDRHLIEASHLSHEMQSLAQGLLVEAVDASLAMGWIEQAFRWSANPGLGASKALRKPAMRAARHWFKNLQGRSLHQVRVYERVREQLARNFRSSFHTILRAKAGTETHVPLVAFVRYHRDHLKTAMQA